MKKILVVALVVAVSLIGASAAMAALSGSDHDLSTTAAGGTSEKCVFCHTPHGANISQGPIWNRSVSPAYVFQMYSIQTGTAVDGTDADVSQTSRACMTCHDGVTALNAVLNGPGDVAAITAVNYGSVNITGTARIGGTPGNDLSDDHPIGVIYDVANGVNPVTDVVAGQTTIKVTGLNQIQGQNGVSRVQCESCHSDVHGTVNQSLFTRVQPQGTYGNDASSMCLTCHNK